MMGPRARARAGCRALAGALCVPVAAVLVAGAAPAQRLSPVASPAAVPSAVPSATPPRIAFTDARDEVAATDEGTSDLGPTLAGQPVTHAGEASVNGAGLSAGISTVDEPNGDVYLTDPPDPDGASTYRLTCDSSIESHPVVSPDGTRVAYASNASGVFRLWLAVLPDGDDPSCDTTTHVELAGAPGGENLWPGWVGTDRLVFSGTGLDPLGDIWIVDVGTPDKPRRDAPATRLTESPAAETQPSHGFVGRVDEEARDLSVVVLTTTQFRPDGSLGSIVLPEADASPGPDDPPSTFTVSSLWAENPPQGSEGVWSPDGDRLAFTTTERDPYGDVVAADVRGTSATRVELGPGSVVDIASEPGRAESHAAWMPRTYGRPQEWRYTVRTATGDVSDVVAADGTGRRTIADASGDVPLDESSPSYSPDGSHIAYSRTAPLAGGREIVMADSDGSGVVVLDDERPDGAVDLEPAWSPDGTRIAFVRFPECECSFRTSEIWVADVESRSAERVTTVPDDTAYWDENPSWSPDGTRLVIARAVEHLHPDLVVRLLGPESVGAGESVEFTAQVDNLGRGTANAVRVSVSAPDLEEELRSGVTLEAVDDACSPTPDGALSCSIERLAPGERANLTFRVLGESAGTFPIDAVASVTDKPDEPVTDNNADSRAIAVTTPPDIVVTAVPTSFSGLGAEGTETVTIRFTVRNDGTEPARSVALVVTSGPDPPNSNGLVSVSASPQACSGAPLRCPLGTVGSGQSRTLEVTVERERYGTVYVRGEVARVAGEVDVDRNTATVTGSTCCPPPSLSAAVPSALLADAPAAGSATQSRTASPPNVAREAPDAPDPPDTTLWVIDLATGAGHELVSPARSTCNCPTAIPGRGPAWSPDGLEVAYENQGSVLILHLADAHGDAVAVRPGTGQPLIDVVTGFTAWSPDEATPTPSRSVISVAEDPAWSPDGTLLAIAGQPAGQPDQRGIYRIAPDGTDLTVVAQGRGPETEPAWQPFADLSVTLAADPGAALLGDGSTMTATVSNAGPTPVTDAVLELTLPAGLSVTSLPPSCTATSQALLSCEVADLPSTQSSVVELPVTGTAAGPQSVRADVGSRVPDPDPTNNTAAATLVVTLVPPPASEPPVTDVSVTVETDPDPGYVGGVGTLTVEVSNSATGTATGIQVTITHPDTIVALTGTPTCFTGQACPIGSLAPGGRRTLTAPIRYLAAGTGSLSASVTSTVTDTSATNDRASRAVTVKQPAVRILQPIGTPGSVAMAVGEEFPPGSQVLLSWDQGLNQREIRAVVAADGTVPPTQVLVFRRDQTGPRLLLATPQEPTQYTAVSTPMLVTPRTVTPPADFVSRN